MQNLLARVNIPVSVLYRNWDASLNEQLFYLGNKAVGTVGEELIAVVLGGSRVKTVKAGYDVRVGKKLIEVKTARESFSATNVKWTWSQIRLDKQQTHLALIAISPEDIRGILLTKRQVDKLELLHQHSKDSMQLKLSEVNFANLHSKHAV